MTDDPQGRTENGEPCCKSDSGGKSSRSSWMKTAILAVVLISAVALARHLIFDCSVNASPGCKSAGCASFGSSCGGCAAAKQCPSSTGQSRKECGLICPTSGPTTNVENTTTDKAVIFLLLKGGDVEASRSASHTLDSLTAKFVEADLPVLSLTLDEGERGFDQIVKQFSVTSLPCIVAFGQGCQSSVVKTSDIGEEALGRAFKRAASDSACATPEAAKSSLKCGASCPSSSNATKGK